MSKNFHFKDKLLVFLTLFLTTIITVKAHQLKTIQREILSNQQKIKSNSKKLAELSSENYHKNRLLSFCNAQNNCKLTTKESESQIHINIQSEKLSQTCTEFLAALKDYPGIISTIDINPASETISLIIQKNKEPL